MVKFDRGAEHEACKKQSRLSCFIAEENNILF